MKYRSDGGTDADDRDPSGRGDFPFFRHETLGQFGEQDQTHDDGGADQDECKIALNLGPQIAHTNTSLVKKYASEYTLRALQKGRQGRKFFFHPDYTVGIGVSPIRRLRARGLYRRWGISPRPEELI